MKLNKKLLKKTFPKSSLFSSWIRHNSVLILAEHNNKDLIAGTLNTITAATKISPNNVSVLVAGSNAEPVVEKAKKIKGVNKVFYANDPVHENPVAENLTRLVVDLHKKSPFTHIFSPASAFGKNVLPRIAGVLDVGAITDVLQIESADTFKRPIYAGNAIQTVKSLDPIKVISIRTTAFEKTLPTNNDAPVESVKSEVDSRVKYVGSQLSKSERPDLQTAGTVVAGGRGMKSGENFELLYQLASKLKAGVGASRAAVDAGFVPNDMQIGQTGKIVAPQLYIAVGISGAIQHLAGMKDSKVIVAINKDTEAPIFQVSDYGLVADLFKAVPELTQKLK